jgi:hypothetical protein
VISRPFNSVRTPNTVLGVRVPERDGIKSLQGLGITFVWNQIAQHMAVGGHVVHRGGVGRTGKRLVSDRHSVQREADKMELFIRTEVARTVKPYNTCYVSPLLMEIDDLSIEEIMNSSRS